MIRSTAKVRFHTARGATAAAYVGTTIAESTHLGTVAVAARGEARETVERAVKHENKIRIIPVTKTTDVRH